VGLFKFQIMKVQFLKNHIGFVKDDIAVINKDIADYLVRCNVVKPVVERVEKLKKKSKK
jgi:thermostable 8-oxoguanine DNA glycosylase